MLRWLTIFLYALDDPELREHPLGAVAANPCPPAPTSPVSRSRPPLARFPTRNRRLSPLRLPRRHHLDPRATTVRHSPSSVTHRRATTT